MTKSILNIAAYKFISLSPEYLPELRMVMKNKALEANLKGTIILSPEGINISLAGVQECIDQFRNFLQSFPEFSNICFRNSWSDFQPFKRLLVRIKKEIISMGHEEIRPEINPVPYLTPKMLRQWYQENKKMVVLDTRNHYEVEYGTFQNALHLGLKNFRGFPKISEQFSTESKQIPIVTFCTGGIRCEKAAIWLRKQGYSQVFQLEGGILNYFEQCGKAYFNGNCYVFDERTFIGDNNGDS